MIQFVKNYYHLIQAIVANILNGFPSKKLTVISITGTDGKTTTSTLLYQMIKASGRKVALISTVAAKIGDAEIDTGFHVTTPSSFALQKLLQEIVQKKMEYVVIETTSHGIDQNRVWGIVPTYAAITNVTHEHLDYHKTYERYVHTKAKLLTQSSIAYINGDATESAILLEDIVKKNGMVQRQPGMIEPDVRSKKYQIINAKDLPVHVEKATRERFGHEHYNYENVAIAHAIARDLGIKEKAIVSAIQKFPGVPGRMQEVTKSRGVRCIVDFAHTPAALEQALKSVKDTKSKGKVIVVFGCAGLRDHTKRPLMGEIASRLADFVVLTAEDPRTEDVWSIISQIKSGVRAGNHSKISSIPDRTDAIRFAYTTLAHPGDTILVTGKGHEKSMCFGNVEYPYNDPDTIVRITKEYYL